MKKVISGADMDFIEPYDGGDVFISRTDGMFITTNVQRTIYRHSPTGFNFGYGGSGAADLALNILVMFARVPDAVTPAIYQEFKWQYVATAAEARLDIKRKDITSFLRKHKIKTK